MVVLPRLAERERERSLVGNDELTAAVSSGVRDLSAAVHGRLVAFYVVLHAGLLLLLAAVWALFDAWSGALLSGAARRLFSPAAGRGSGVELTGGTGARVDGSSSASGPGSVTERTGGGSGCGTQFFRLLPLAVSKNPLADMAYFTGGSK